MRAWIEAAADTPPGLTFRHVRIERGLSQQGLAKILDVPQSTISEIENGKSTIFLRRLPDMARATGIQFSATWEGGSEDQA